MSEIEPLPRIRRILVALDSSPQSLAALETAVELAGEFRADLLGLFVEDINIVRMTALPLAREVASFSATIRRLDPLQLERQLKAQAYALRRSIALVAARARVEWSFRAVRGVVASEVVGAAAEADLIILGRSGRSASDRVGSTVRAVISQGRCLTLIVAQGWRLQAPVILVFDGSRLAAKALNLATSLAKLKSKTLSVVTLADSREGADELRASMEGVSDLKKLRVDHRVLLHPSLAGLTRTIRAIGEGPLVVPCAPPLLQGEPLQQMVEHLRNPILLTR